MFVDFFYKLKEVGIPVSPTAFLTLQKALRNGLVNTLDDFYTAARAILVKSERYFDLYDQVFAHHFQGAELPDFEGIELDELARTLLEGWLQNPRELSKLLGMDESALAKLTPEELIEYFKERLKEQTEAHHGGAKWIGTGGYSPVGHSGYHPGGMRVGGVSGNKSAVKVAMDRRYKDYSQNGPLTLGMVGEALKRLRNQIGRLWFFAKENNSYSAQIPLDFEELLKAFENKDQNKSEKIMRNHVIQFIDQIKISLYSN